MGIGIRPITQRQAERLIEDNDSMFPYGERPLDAFLKFEKGYPRRVQRAQQRAAQRA